MMILKYILSEFEYAYLYTFYLLIHLLLTYPVGQDKCRALILPYNHLFSCVTTTTKSYFKAYD